MDQTNRLIAKLGFLSVSSLIMFAAPAFGNSHTEVSASRDGGTDHVYVTQSLDGEYGTYKLLSANAPSSNSSNTWMGKGLTTSVGVEWMKFIQLGISHTLVNVSERDNSNFLLQGSRISADAKMIFYSPIGNIELGGGSIGSFSDIHYNLTTTSYMGSGYYTTLGINYFISSRVSLQAIWKDINENFVRTGGDSTYGSVKTHVNSLGLGVDLWI